MRFDIYGKGFEVRVRRMFVERPTFIPESDLLAIPPNWTDTIWVCTKEQHIKNNLFYDNDFIAIAENDDIVIAVAKRDMKDSPVECIVEIRVDTDSWGKAL